MWNIETCKSIACLTNQLCYWFGLLEDWAPTHSMVSILTNLIEDNCRAFKHQVTFGSSSPPHFGGGCPLRINGTNIGLHNLQILSPHIRCPRSR